MSTPANEASVPVEVRSCRLAVWSMVLGILAVLACGGPLLGIPAVICGHIALSRIGKSGGVLRGQRSAITGLVMGYFGTILLPVIGLLMAIAIPNFVRAREKAQMDACANNIRLIESAKREWAKENVSEALNGPTAADLAHYFELGMPVCPAEGVYRIRSLDEPAVCSLPEHRRQP